MLLDTGIRPSELISIDFENVNPITGAVQILNGKGGKFRMVYLSKKNKTCFKEIHSDYGN